MQVTKCYIKFIKKIENMSEVVEYQRLRIEALTAELQRLQLLLNEVSEISTAKARDIKVLISDPNFDKPLIEIDYGK